MSGGSSEELHYSEWRHPGNFGSARARTCAQGQVENRTAPVRPAMEVGPVNTAGHVGQQWCELVCCA